MIANLIIILALSGPPVDVEKQDIHILLDTKDTRNKNVIFVNKSKIIASELQRDWMPGEKFYINQYWNVILEELEDKRFDKIPPYPSFRFSKNQDWQEFCPGTFQASGTFFLSLYSILKWEDYIEQLEKWKEWKDNYTPYVEKTYKCLKFKEWPMMKYEPGKPAVQIGTYKTYSQVWKIQPPDHPFTFPAYEDKSTAFYFYNYQPRIVDAADWIFNVELQESVRVPKILNIDIPQGYGECFYWEFDNFTMWWTGIK